MAICVTSELLISASHSWLQKGVPELLLDAHLSLGILLSPLAPALPSTPELNHSPQLPASDHSSHAKHPGSPHLPLPSLLRHCQNLVSCKLQKYHPSGKSGNSLQERQKAHFLLQSDRKQLPVLFFGIFRHGSATEHEDLLNGLSCP